MSFYQWLYFCTIGNLEYILLGRYLFGLQKRKLPYQIAAPIVAGLVGYVCYKMGMLEFYSHFIWVLFLLIVNYRLSLKLLIRYTILIVLFTSAMDMLVFSLYFVLLGKNELDSDFYILSSGGIGFLIFCVIFVFLKRKSYMKKVSEFFRNMSNKDISLLCVGLFVILLLFANIQGFYLNELTPKLKRAAVFLCIIVVILMIIVFLYLENVILKQRYMEEIREINRNYLRAQTQYMEQSKERYEELKSFRHDIRQHFQVLEFLAEEGQCEKIQEYIKKIQGGNLLRTMNYTGNVIADSLIQEIFGEYMDQAGWNFSFLGKFDEKIPLDEMDLCILLSNGFRNAREAMTQCKEKVFHMEVSQDAKELCMILENSIPNSEIDITKTEKEDTENHGYGVGNMKRVVEENKGTIFWDVQGKQMRISVYIPLTNEKNR